jgi:site-specific DNA-adenine methylase
MIKQVMYKSFLKYPGGKSKVLPFILPYFSKADIFVEPFVGSGVVFLNTDYKEYLLADINTFINENNLTINKDYSLMDNKVMLYSDFSLWLKDKY